MAIGDAGDDFAEQVLRATMDVAKDLLRYIDGIGMPHTGWKDRYESAREDAGERAAAAFLAQEGEDMEPGQTWLWAPNAKEADELCAFLDRKGYEHQRLKPRKSDGVVKVRLEHNEGAVPLVDGGEYDPVDFEDPETIETIDAYSYSQCMSHLAVLADAEAMKRALVEASKNIEYVPGSPDNCVFHFKTVQWDEDGSVLLDYLDRAGIQTESWVCDVPEEVKGEPGVFADVPAVAVEFDARNAPHIQAAVSALLSSGIRGLDQKRFPGFGKAIRDAQLRASAIYGREDLGYETLSVADREAAETVRGLLVAEGVACAAVERAEAGEWDLVVDRADAIASQWRIKELASEYEAPAKQAKAASETLSKAAKKSDERRSQPEEVRPKTKSSKYARSARDTPARDEQVARKGAASVNRSRSRGVAIESPSIAAKRPSR